MKTRKNSLIKAGMKIMFMSGIISSVLLSSCGEKKSNEALTPNPDSVYVMVDQLPVFKGGDAALLQYIAEKTVYPEDAVKNNIQGKVIVRFVVRRDGTITDAEVLKGIDPTLDAEAVRVVSTLPAFEKPALIKGVPANVHYMVPIQFTLK